MTTYRKKIAKLKAKNPVGRPVGIKVERKQVEYDLFVQFMALPGVDRSTLFDGITTQTEFAAKYKVNPATLSEWKKEKNFWEELEDARRKYFRERMGNVWRAVEHKAIKDGTAPEAKLLAEYMGSMKKEADMPQVAADLAAAINKISNLLP
jgi:hypothetical protein